MDAGWILEMQQILKENIKGEIWLSQNGQSLLVDIVNNMPWKYVINLYELNDSEDKGVFYAKDIITKYSIILLSIGLK
jgi:hypothetical protein